MPVEIVSRWPRRPGEDAGRHSPRWLEESALPASIPLGTTHHGCMALSTQLCLILVPLDHEPFGCLEDPSVPFARPFLLLWATAASQLQTPRGSVPLIPRWLGTPYGLRLCIFAKS